MPWLLVLHISAVLFWCASLLYLPALIAGGKAQADFDLHNPVALSRMLFTRIVTPAAMLAIVSGTVIFVAADVTALWLVLKLTLVSGLVICHALTGWLMMRVGQDAGNSTCAACVSLGAASAVFAVSIIAAVLMKPF